MSKLNEKKIIELFQSRLGNTNFVPEDVETFKIGKKHLIVKVDLSLIHISEPTRRYANA